MISYELVFSDLPDLGLAKSLLLLFMRRGGCEPTGAELGPEPGVPQALTAPVMKHINQPFVNHVLGKYLAKSNH